MIRLVALAVLCGSLYLALLGEVQQMDEKTLQQRAELRAHRANQ
jgi:hypothetical protein